jgi:hypothetical protein
VISIFQKFRFSNPIFWIGLACCLPWLMGRNKTPNDPAIGESSNTCSQEFSRAINIRARADVPAESSSESAFDENSEIGFQELPGVDSLRARARVKEDLTAESNSETTIEEDSKTGPGELSRAIIAHAHADEKPTIVAESNNISASENSSELAQPDVIAAEPAAQASMEIRVKPAPAIAQPEAVIAAEPAAQAPTEIRVEPAPVFAQPEAVIAAEPIAQASTKIRVEPAPVFAQLETEIAAEPLAQSVIDKTNEAETVSSAAEPGKSQSVAMNPEKKTLPGKLLSLAIFIVIAAADSRERKSSC